MSVGRTVGKVLVGGLAAAALSGVGLAFADADENLCSTTTGASAWSDLKDNSNGSASVKDKVCILYDRKYNTGFRMNNEGGVDSTTTSGSDAANYVAKVTACVNLNNTPDRCGLDDRPGDGR